MCGSAFLAGWRRRTPSPYIHGGVNYRSAAPKADRISRAIARVRAIVVCGGWLYSSTVQKGWVERGLARSCRPAVIDAPPLDEAIILLSRSRTVRRYSSNNPGFPQPKIHEEQVTAALHIGTRNLELWYCGVKLRESSGPRRRDQHHFSAPFNLAAGHAKGLTQ